ncbi:MAG TPA: YaeQ family protein [Burkholderiaceae bacterium]
MALRSVVHKADLRIADLGRAHYADYALTVARHPSETEERMMMRLLAFAMHARERLEFGRGLSTDDEPDLWRRDLTGAIELWIDVGLPDARLVRKAAGRAREVVVVSYGAARAEAWWAAQRGALERIANLGVYGVAAESSRELAALADRSMRLDVTIQEGQLWFSNGAASVCVEPAVLKGAQ